jgi:hypothetical protein
MNSLAAGVAAGVATVTIAVAPVAVADRGPAGPAVVAYGHHCGHGGFHGYGHPGGYGWGYYRHWWPWRW